MEFKFEGERYEEDYKGRSCGLKARARARRFQRASG